MKKIPTLIFARMCQFFAQYGVRTLMVLYLIESLKKGDTQALTLNVIFVTLFEVGSTFGGMIADRLLGFKRTLLLGGVLLTLGFSSLILSQHLILSFGLMILGGNLFSSNVPALIGRETAYDEKRQKKVFIHMYALQNLGALAAIPLLSFLKEFYGYTPPFLVAGAAMTICVIALSFIKIEKKIHPQKGTWKAVLGLLSMPLMAFLFMQNQQLATIGLIALGIVLALIFLIKVFTPGMILAEKRGSLLVALFAIVIFFAVEDQTLSSFILFAERVCHRDVFGVTIPAAMVAMMNPIVIGLFSPLIARSKKRIVFPFVISGLGLLALSLTASTSIVPLLMVVAVISLSELYVGPLVYQCAADSAHEGKRGEVMGVVPIAFSLAFILSGFLSRLVIAGEGVSQVTAFTGGFQKMSILLLIASVGLVIMQRRKREFFSRIKE